MREAGLIQIMLSVNVGIKLSKKYSRLAITYNSLYDSRVVWIKLEGIQGNKFGIACIFTPNISTEHRHLRHIVNQ